MSKLKLWMGMAVVMAATITVRADVIALWNNDDATGLTSTPADTVHTDMSSSNLALGSGLAVNSWNNSLSAYANTLTTSLAASITAADYFTFTLTPNAGKAADYANVFLRTSINTGNSATDCTIGFYLFSEATGFTSADALGSFSLTRPAGSTVVVTTTYNFDVSGASALQGVDVATEFRIYTVTLAGSPNKMSIGYPFAVNGTDDLRVDGTVTAVPEPATVGMLGLGALVTLLVRRFRNR